jgi:16S rRNA (adenine(1408)-N(1))-methyltransferase
VTIDVGAGDGRAVMATAIAEPTSLVIGLDANAASMVESSRRAVRGHVSNVLFVVAAAEAIPPELVGIADQVTISFPWGSLLSGSLGLDAAVATGIASLLATGGEVELLLAPSPRDGLAGVPTEPATVVRAAESTFAALGFELIEGRGATAAELAASRSTWAKRLRSGGRSADRPVTLVRLRSSRR